MSAIEGLRNIIHREIRRVLDRQTRRVPCTVDSYDPTQHTIKLKLQPEGTLTGWVQIAAAQVGVQIAPNIGDPGWLDFHEADRRAAVFSGSNHNDLNPPPVQIAAGEWRAQNKAGGGFLYLKNDGSIIANDGAGGSITLKGGIATIVAPNGVSVTAPTSTINGNLVINGSITAGGAGTGEMNITGTVNVTGEVISNGIPLSTHVHNGVQSGSDESGAPLA